MNQEKIDKLIKKLTNKPGLRAKVDAMCTSCIYDPIVPGSWRKQVQECRVITCPLHSVRAKQTVKETFHATDKQSEST